MARRTGHAALALSAAYSSTQTTLARFNRDPHVSRFAAPVVEEGSCLIAKKNDSKGFLSNVDCLPVLINV